MALVVLIAVLGIAVAGFCRWQAARPLLLLLGCMGLLFALGVALNLTASPDTAPRAGLAYFLGPPQAFAGMALRGFALLISFCGVVVLAPRILLATPIRRDRAAHADRERELLERQERRRAAVAARKAESSDSEYRRE